MADRFSKSSIGVLAVLAALGIGPAAAQDFSAGKTAAQLFQSDCTACHKSPAGLAKGKDSRSLTAFLREHYTTKEESAVALAAYLAGAGPGPAERAETKPKPQAPATAAAPGGPNAPKPKSAARSAEGETEANTTREEPSRRTTRTPAPGREGARAETEETVRKLNSYAAARGDARATERSADAVKKLESYASAGSPADALDEANKPKVSQKKKKSATSANAAPAAPAHPPAARHPPAAVIQRPPGNN